MECSRTATLIAVNKKPLTGSAAWRIKHVQPSKKNLLQCKREARITGSAASKAEIVTFSPAKIRKPLTCCYCYKNNM